MVSSATQALDTERGSRARMDRVFFGAMAIVCGATILGGFVPTFFLRSALSSGARPLAPLVVAHGTVFTLWVLLYVAQTALIAAGRRGMHRALGVTGGLAAAAAFAIGVPMIAAFERTHGAEAPFTLAVHAFANGGPLTLFALFAIAGVLCRRTPDVHKRLMLFATLALQPAGFSRLIGYLGIGPWLNVPFFGVLCASVLAYDWCVDRRVRPVTLLGTLLLFGTVYGTDLLFMQIEP